MKLTQHDISGMDNKMCEKISSNKREENEENDSEDELEEKSGQAYNPNWTLRKCVSKILDRISIVFPKLTVDYSKLILENDLQCQDWIKK